MAVIETHVSRKLASSILQLILFVFLVSSQIACYKPPSTVSSVHKNSLSATIPSAGFSGEVMTNGSGFQPTPVKYRRIVRKYANSYELDWLLILSVMKQESQFRPNAVSRVGAYGLMQIMPITQVELSEKLGVNEARSPYNNIKAGAFHFRSLYRIFRDAREEDRIKLSLAAYNAGLGRILDARQMAAYLGNDPNSWNSVKKALPLLSKRYYTLHKNIWDVPRPPSGYFRNWKQTTRYVGKVLEHYDQFALAYE